MSAFRLVLLLLLLCAGGAHAQFADNRASASLLQGSSNQADFLPVHQAFKPGVLDASADALALIVDIAPGYYLYRHRLQVSTDDGSVLQMQLPEGIHKTDEYFGDVEVYYNQLQIQLDPATLIAELDEISSGGELAQMILEYERVLTL